MFLILPRVVLAYRAQKPMHLYPKNTIGKNRFILRVMCLKEEMYLETFIVSIIPSKSIMAAFSRQLL